MKYNWEHGENAYQEYYDVYVGKDYLIVFRLLQDEHNTWTGCYVKDGSPYTLLDKTKNDCVRKRDGLPKNCDHSKLREFFLLTGTPEYLMKKTEYCYERGIVEVKE